MCIEPYVCVLGWRVAVQMGKGRGEVVGGMAAVVASIMEEFIFYKMSGV